ncbi:MAG: hypothetical protein NT178_17350 [Proteobacteria bacterium]|nr:hypothetical protein [Pseudomonadota bacterium]
MRYYRRSGSNNFAIYITVIISVFLTAVFLAPASAEIISITKEIAYEKTHIDTRESSRIIASAQGHKLIFDETAGFFNADNAYQLSKAQLSLCAAGIVIPEIISERWYGNKLYLTLQAKTDRETIAAYIILSLKDKEKIEELQETRRNIEGVLKDIIKLQKDQLTRYLVAVDLLNREQLMERGYALRNRERYEESIEAFNKIISPKQTQTVLKQEMNIGKITTYAANLRARPSPDSNPT